MRYGEQGWRLLGNLVPCRRAWGTAHDDGAGGIGNAGCQVWCRKAVCGAQKGHRSSSRNPRRRADGSHAARDTQLHWRKAVVADPPLNAWDRGRITKSSARPISVPALRRRTGVALTPALARIAERGAGDHEAGDATCHEDAGDGPRAKDRKSSRRKPLRNVRAAAADEQRRAGEQPGDGGRRSR